MNRPPAAWGSVGDITPNPGSSEWWILKALGVVERVNTAGTVLETVTLQPDGGTPFGITYLDPVINIPDEGEGGGE